MRSDDSGNALNKTFHIVRETRRKIEQVRDETKEARDAVLSSQAAIEQSRRLLATQAKPVLFSELVICEDEAHG